MTYFFGFLLDLAQNPLFILFVIQIGTIGYLRQDKKHLEEKMLNVQKQIDSSRQTNKELTTKYHLLDTHVILLSHILESQLDTKLTIQGPHGDWRTSRPLNGN